MSSSRRSRKRDNQSATTFWMDNEMKIRAQNTAQNMRMTMTDLINRAVSFYLAKGIEIDEKIDIPIEQKLTTASINLEAMETRAVFMRMKHIEHELEVVMEKLRDLEGGIENAAREKVQAEMKETVMPVLAPLYIAIERLNSQIPEYENPDSSEFDGDSLQS